tara:strand:- start:2417 stop:3088 length:672 start_codon:yes stop_codon:yes gene_type:complete
MVYYLGSDVNVHMTTEHGTYTVSGGASNVTATGDLTNTNGIGNNGADFSSVIPKRGTGLTAASKLTDVIGVDFTPGTRQEEISYMGKNTNLQAEIKKELILTITRKVSENFFDALFNTPARDGVFDSASADGTGGTKTLHDGLRTSKNQNFGYRLHLELKSSTTNGEGEVITLRNCCITAHTRTLDANNAQEETIEFYSYVQPVISGDGTVTAATAITGTDEI